MSEANYDYGACHTCGEAVIARTIQQDFWIKGQLIVVENVPAGVCPQCGEKIVNAETGQQIAATLAKPDAMNVTRTINVPVVSLKAAA
ncbi:MAG: YgiT-type zinc finger protein [Acidobacteria bacterium]|nr:YgiT-type zinc finger protein [Acidobacteriota bacterium]